MDTTTFTPTDAAWELIADLAAVGSDITVLADQAALAQRIVERVSAALPCPWVALVLHTTAEPLVVAHGLDEGVQIALIERTAAAPTAAYDLPLTADDRPAGMLWIGATASGDPVLTPSFSNLLRRQVELLIGMQRRERARYTAQLEAARELFIIHENGKIVTSGLTTETMLARITENIALALRVDRCSIHLRNRDERQTLVEVASYSFDEDAASLVSQASINGAGPIAEAISTGVAQTVGTESVDQYSQVFGLTTALLLPLKNRDDVLGLLVIGYHAQQQFSRSEQNLAQTLADQVAIAVAGAQATDAEQRRVRELDALQELHVHLASDQSLDEVLHAILRGVRGFVPFAAAQISLFDQDTQQVVVGSRLGFANDRSGEQAEPQPLTVGLAGWLGRYRQPLRMATFEQPPVAPQPTKLANGSSPASYLGIPLVIGEQLVGTLELMSDRPHGFNLDHERLLQLIAAQAAQAIASARNASRSDTHLRSRVQQLAALQRISRQLTATLSLDLIFRFALDEALMATTATQAFIALRSGGSDGLPVTDADSGALIAIVAVADTITSEAFSILTAAGYGEAETALVGQSLQIMRTTASEALMSGEPRLVDDANSDDRPNGIGPAVAAALAIPVYYEDQIVGVVNLHSHRPHAFDHDTVEFVRALTDQVALALGNARRYEEQQRQRTLLQQRANMLKQVLDIGHALRADQSIEEVLEQIAFSIIETTGFRRALFNLVDTDDRETMSMVAGAGVTLAEMSRLRRQPWPAGLVERILQKRFLLGRCFFIPSEAADDVWRDMDVEAIALPLDVEVSSADEWHAEDALFVPLYSTDARLLGMISVDEPYNRMRPTARSLEVLEVLADQAAIAVENASLLREARAQTDQVRALYQVGQAAVSTLSLNELLERVYTEIAAYMGDPAIFYVAAYGAQRQTVTFELFKQHGQTLESHTKRVEPKQGFAQLVIDSGEPVDIRDATSGDLPPDGLPAAGEAMQSLVGIPLRSQNQVIGVLSVQSERPNAFAERQIRFLGSLANQLAIALENARLFQERERRIAELDVVNEIGRITSTSRDMSSMFTQVYERLHSFLPIDSGFIFAYNPAQSLIDMSLEADDAAPTIDVTPRQVSTDSLTERILRENQPLLFQDLRIERRPAGVKPMRFGNLERLSASWLGVPMLGNDSTMVGVLSIQSYTPNLYSQRELSFLTAVASQLALGIQNVRLLSRTQEQVRQLGLLNRASLVASSTLDLGTIYQAIVDVMGEALEVDQARLMLFDRERDAVWIAAEMVQSTHEGADIVPITGTPWVAWLDEQRKPVVVADVANEPLFEGRHTVLHALGIESLVIVPLIVAGSVIGAVGLDSIGRQRSFSAEAVDLCQSIANQASIAIEKARLFSEVERNAQALGSKVGELSTLLEAARVLSSSLEPTEVLNRLMDVVGRHLSVSTVGLWRITADNMLRPAALLGIPQDVAEQMSVPVGSGLTGSVAASSAPLIVADVAVTGGSLYPDFNREHHLTSFMGVPVIYGKQIIGVLSVMTIQGREFTHDEQALLAGMADQAAIALENARLFEEGVRRIAELTSFNQISQRLNAALDLETLLQIVHEEIGQVLDHRDSFIALYDAANQKIAYPIFWEDGAPSTRTTVIDAVNEPSLSRRVIADRRPVLLRSHEAMMRYMAEAGFAPAYTVNIASWLAVPIIEGDEVFGILNVQHVKPNAYDDADLRFLTTVAGLAATSIARAQLYNERVRRLSEVSVLQEISSAITSTLNLQEVLETLHAELGRVVDVSTSFIALYEPGNGILSYPIVYDQGTRMSMSPFLAKKGVNHWVITNRQPLRFGRDSETWDYRPIDENVRLGPADKIEQSYLVVPIISGEDVLGVINVQSYQEDAFTAEDLRFVSAVANQAAAAINNARLFQDRERRIKELSTFNDIGRQFSAVPKLDELLELIYQRTSPLLNTTNFYIGLYDEYTHSITFPMFYHAGSLVDTPPLTEQTSLSHQVIRSRQPLLIQGDQQAEQMAALGIAPVGAYSRSWLGVPMIANNQVVGVIAIQDYERENAYTSEDVRLLSTLAMWSAVALSNARMFTEQRQSLEELGLLYDMSMQLAGTLDPAEVQKIVVLNALELLHAQVGALILLDERQQVTHEFVYDVDHPTEDHPPIGNSPEVVQPLLGLERPLMVRDLSVRNPLALATKFGVRGLLGEAIGQREQPIGTLWIGDRQPREWQSRELSMISIIATLSSQALKSAYLFQREQARRVVADTLRTVAARLTGVLALDDIYALLLDQLALVVPYDSASLMLREDNTNFLRIVVTRGFGTAYQRQVEQVRFDLHEDKALQSIIDTNSPLVLADAQLSEGFVPIEGTEHIRAWIGVPLLLGDEVTGLLTIDNRQVGAYDDDDAQIAFTLASQSAQAIRTARLFKEVHGSRAELELRVDERTAALAELNMQLADEKQRLQAVHAITVELAASLEMQETLRKTLQLVAQTLGVRRGSIMLWDEQERQLVCRAVLGEDGKVYAENIPIAFQRSNGLAGWVRDNQQPICVGDVRKDRRWVQERGRAQEVRSVVAVPLGAEGVGTLGVLMLTSPQLNYFTPAHEQMLSTIANEVAIVIHNAELYSLVQEYANKLSKSFDLQIAETGKNQAILRSLGEGVIVLDEAGRVVLFNPAAEEILGIAESQFLGQKFADMADYSATASARDRAEIIYEAISTGLRTLDSPSRSQQMRLELVNPAQSLELYFTPVVGQERLNDTVVVLRDMTREIEADRAKRDFISSVSHELRTPLTAIKGYVDLLTLGAAGPISENQAAFLSVVKNNANRLMDLINDILEIGRIDANKIQLNFEPVDLREIFHDAIQTTRTDIERKQMQVNVLVADDLPLIEGDARRLMQVVLNLVSNAVKYTYPEGEIELRASLNPSGMLEVAVKDNGVGMTVDQQGYLFRRFYRADNPLRDEAGGTGLGLSIAKSYVELHGGEMWVQSEINVGSTFFFVVPLHQPEQVVIEP